MCITPPLVPVHQTYIPNVNRHNKCSVKIIIYLQRKKEKRKQAKPVLSVKLTEKKESSK